MSGLILKTLTAIALAASCSLCASAWAETPVSPPATAEPAPVPVVRQSTPIPNDPEPVRPAKPKEPKPAADGETGAAGPEELDKPMAHRCFVRDVMVFYDRTHVRCYNPARGKYNFFAVDTSQPVAETLLNKAWKSMRSGKPLTITYAPTPDLNPTGCDVQNCRRLIDVLN
jgi:hypothetical protein